MICVEKRHGLDVIPRARLLTPSQTRRLKGRNAPFSDLIVFLEDQGTCEGDTSPNREDCWKQATSYSEMECMGLPTPFPPDNTEAVGFDPCPE